MKALLTIAFLVPLGADLLDRVIAWARKRWQVEVPECGVFPPYRFVLWVRITHDWPAMDHDLLIIALPSYEWMRNDYGRKWCWHRREIYRRSRRWVGRVTDNGWAPARWGVELVPVE